MDWVDDWLAGLVHRTGATSPTERFRHERFIVGRTAAAAAALAAIPPYLLGRGAPTALEALSLAVMLVPLAAVALLARTGRLGLAQMLVSGALALFCAAAAAPLAATPLALLALVAVPLDAVLAGARGRALLGSLACAAAGIPLALLLRTAGMEVGEGASLLTLFGVGLALALGHAAAQAVSDHRLKAQLNMALRAGEARESATLQAIDDLVTWHDRTGAVIRANQAGSRLLGTKASALHGKGLFARIHVADRPAYLKAISDAAGAAEPVVVRFRVRVGEAGDPLFDANPVLARLRPKADEVVWVEMRAHRLRGAGEDSATVVAVTRSIAEHKQRAEELEALHRAAKQAGEDRAQLLATVSHELRTPLNAIIGYAEMLKGRGDEATAGQGYAEVIHRSGEHMLGVVSTLLDLSTIERGCHELEPEPLDVAELVGEACRTMQLTAERAGVSIAQNLAPNMPELWADRHACQQILLNLLSNAVKFTPRGGLVTVQARREGERIALTVRDTGIGVLAAELPRLGDPFYRAVSTRGRAEKGNGLGLSVVRGLVGLHQGRMAIASAPGDGTSVTVTLPVEAGARRRGAPSYGPIDLRSRKGALALRTG